MKKNKYTIKGTLGLLSIMGISAFTTHIFTLQKTAENLENYYYCEINDEPTIIKVFEESEERSCNIQYMTVTDDFVKYRWDKNLPEEITPLVEAFSLKDITHTNNYSLDNQLIKFLEKKRDNK